MEKSFRIGDWLAEPGLNTIRKEDRVEHLEPKTMDVLAYLARNPGEVLDRDQILEAVWPDTFVGDSTLTYAVVGLRKALGDDSKKPEYIRTIPKRGYRLIAPVIFEPFAESDSTPPETQRPLPGFKRAYLRAGVAVVVILGAIGLFHWTFNTASAHPYLSQPSLYVLDGETPRRLASGEDVKPGDELFMEFEAAEDLYVYVLNQDEKGESYLLFPQPEYELSNPVPSGREVRLPGPSQGEELVWQVSSAGGREHFLVVTSQQRLPELESTAHGFSNPDFGEPVVLADSGSDEDDPDRGVGRLKRKDLASFDQTATPPFHTLLSQLRDDAGVWIHQFELENRGN